MSVHQGSLDVQTTGPFAMGTDTAPNTGYHHNSNTHNDMYAPLCKQARLVTYTEPSCAPTVCQPRMSTSRCVPCADEGEMRLILSSILEPQENDDGKDNDPNSLSPSKRREERRVQPLHMVKCNAHAVHHEHEGDDLDLAGHIPFGRPPEGKQPTRVRRCRPKSSSRQHKEMNEKKRYRCTLCHTHRTFTRRGDARRHIRKSCKRSIHKVDQCPRCGDTLSRNDSVQRHAPICTGIPSKKRGHDKRDSGVGDDSFDARGRSDDELDRFIDLIG